MFFNSCLALLNSIIHYTSHTLLSFLLGWISSTYVVQTTSANLPLTHTFLKRTVYCIKKGSYVFEVGLSIVNILAFLFKCFKQLLFFLYTGIQHDTILQTGWLRKHLSNFINTASVTRLTAPTKTGRAIHTRPLASARLENKLKMYLFVLFFHSVQSVIILSCIYFHAFHVSLHNTTFLACTEN